MSKLLKFMWTPSSTGEGQHHRGCDRTGLDQPEGRRCRLQPPRCHLLHASRHPLCHTCAHSCHGCCKFTWHRAVFKPALQADLIRKCDRRLDVTETDPNCHVFALGVIYEVWHSAHFPGGIDPGGYCLLQLPGQPGWPGGAQRPAEGSGAYSKGRRRNPSKVFLQSRNNNPSVSCTWLLK